MTKQRGDKYRPTVTVLKVKKDVPTVIAISGRVYILQGDYRGGTSK